MLLSHGSCSVYISDNVHGPALVWSGSLLLHCPVTTVCCLCMFGLQTPPARPAWWSLDLPARASTEHTVTKLAKTWTVSLYPAHTSCPVLSIQCKQSPTTPSNSDIFIGKMFGLSSGTVQSALADIWQAVYNDISQTFPQPCDDTWWWPRVQGRGERV